MTTPAATMLRNELQAVIRRYSSESDVTICEALGVIEMVKNDLITRINEAQVPDGDSDD